MDFLVLFGVLFFSIIFGLLAYFLSWIFRHKSKNNALNSSYECGLDVPKNLEIQFGINYFTFCICFLLFETGCALMFPFAYIKGQTDIFYTVEIMIFILILILILLFNIKSGFLKLDQEDK